MANFMPTLERSESVNVRQRKADLQNNRNIVTFHYRQGFNSPLNI